MDIKTEINVTTIVKNYQKEIVWLKNNIEYCKENNNNFFDYCHYDIDRGLSKELLSLCKKLKINIIKYNTMYETKDVKDDFAMCELTIYRFFLNDDTYNFFRTANSDSIIKTYQLLNQTVILHCLESDAS